MVDFQIIFKVLADWRFLISLAVFITISIFSFIKLNSSGKSKSKRKKPIKGNDHMKQPIENKPDESGKLYVPDSNYDMLKKEGLIHPKE